VKLSDIGVRKKNKADRIDNGISERRGKGIGLEIE
jgi:hypothetical protein